MNKYILQKYFYDIFFNTKNYFTLWLIGFLINILRWSEIIITGILIFKYTNSPFQVTLLLILRFLSLMSFGVFAGIMIDKYNKKYCLSLSLILMALISLAFYKLIPLDNKIYILQIYSVLSGLFWAVETTARKALIIESINKEHYAKNISLDTFTLQMTRFVGPLVSGYFHDYFTLPYLLLFASFTYTLTFLISTLIKYSKQYSISNDKIRYDYKFIYKIILEQKNLLLVFLITIIFNIWAYAYIALLPAVIEIEDFYDTRHISFLVSVEGLGSLISIIVVFIYDRHELYIKYYIIGTIVTLICGLLFPFSPNIHFAFVILFIAGIGAGFFSAMQPILIALYSPPNYRGAMLGVLNLCIGLATIGYLHVGLLSTYFGVKEAIYISSMEGLLIILMSLFMFKKIIFKH